MDSGGWLFPGKPWALRAKPAKFIFKLLAPPRPRISGDMPRGPIGPGRLLMVALSVPGVYLLLHPLFTQNHMYLRVLKQGDHLHFRHPGPDDSTFSYCAVLYCFTKNINS